MKKTSDTMVLLGWGTQLSLSGVSKGLMPAYDMTTGQHLDAVKDVVVGAQAGGRCCRGVPIWRVGPCQTLKGGTANNDTE